MIIKRLSLTLQSNKIIVKMEVKDINRLKLYLLRKKEQTSG